MKIEVVNSIWAKAIDNEARGKIYKLLRYKKTWFKQGQYGKIKQSRLASFVDSRSGFFLAGFLPKVVKHFPQAEIGGKMFYDLEASVPALAAITFRSDQVKAIKAAVQKQRGVIRFATASGKTVIAAGIISCFKNRDAIFLAHSKDIVNQTYERFKEYGFNTGILTGDRKENLEATVLCATYQTYIKQKKIILPDVVIVDEAHHVNSTGSQYGKILTSFDVPIRIGLTGTLPNSKEGKLALEGLIGPVIARLSISEGVKKGLLSLPKITLFPVKKIKRFTDLRQYYEIREHAIVNNRMRNRLIARAVKRRVEKKKSCLIIVNEINHGDNLKKELEGVAIFLQGKTPAQNRNKAKQELIGKKQLAVITTNIWNEGVDIPTLDCVVIAFGGKANTRTIQALGRGLRRTEKKKRVEIIDFLDPYRYLAEHVVARLTIYKKEKLL